MIVLTSFLVVLLLAGLVLVWEARTGRLDPRSQAGASVRAALFFAALVIGAALLVRTFGSSPILALALTPVTALSLYRLAMLVRPVVGRSARQAVASVSVLVVVLALGLSASLALLPEPLDQRVIVEKIFYGDSPADQRSIDPAARRTSRV